MVTPTVTHETMILVDAKSVIAMIQGVELALSPMGLTDFLGDEVAYWFAERVEQRFEAEGDSVSGKWAPLAASTQAIRSSLGYGATGPINVRTTSLYDYVSQTGKAVPVPGGAMYTTPGAPAQGELAAKMEHAQVGGVSDSGKPYPARPVLGMDLKDLGAVLELLDKHINRGGSLVV